MKTEFITDRHYKNGRYFAKYFPETDTFEWKEVPDYIDKGETERKYREAYLSRNTTKKLKS